MKIKIKILLICLLVLCFSSTISNAAIEIKPNTSSYYNVTASDAFDLCRSMTSGSTLGTSNLDPHSTLNADWGAVAYLGLSAYGGMSAAKTQKGVTININGRSYYSTTPNITGVMNMGNSETTTASLYNGVEDSAITNNALALKQNRNTKYVESLGTIDETKGMAIGETNGWFGAFASYVSTNYYIAIRKRTESLK